MKRLVVFLAFILFSIYCRAETIYVDIEAVGYNSGNTWANAYTSLQNALDDAAAGDEIWVAEGTYHPTHRIVPADSRSAVFQLKNNVTIYGGFDPDSGVTTMKYRDWDTYRCILSGDINIKNDTSDNCYHVLYHNSFLGLDRSALLDGFIISDGNADGTDDKGRGGGMYNDACSPTLINCTFKNNRAYYGGGAVYNTSLSKAGFGDCLFRENSSQNSGGAIYNDGSSPTFNGCTLGSSDYLAYNTADFGGAMYNIDSNPIITDSTFDSNQAASGGAIYNDNSSPVITDCTFTENDVQGTASNSKGGAIANFNGSSPSVTDSTFVWNIAFGDAQGKGGAIYCDSTSSPSFHGVEFDNNISHCNGGAVYCDGGTATLDSDCNLHDNSAADGGAIYCISGAAPSITNSTFESNTAHDNGGAIYSSGASPSITNCSITQNEADGNGGGIAFFLSSGGTVSGCNISNNSTTVTSTLGGGIYCSASSPVITNCNIRDNATHVGAGIACEDYASIEISNTTVAGNNAVQDGGGVSIGDGSSAEITNCIIVENDVAGESGGYGVAGGLGVVGDATATVKNCTIANNTSRYSPGGIYSFGGTITVANSIIYGNSGTQISGDAIAVSFSDIEGSFTGTGNIDVAPDFVDTSLGNYHLQRTSQCIDAGNNSSAAGITTDIDGDDRIIDSDSNGSAVVDMGADEVTEIPPAVWVDDDYSEGGDNDGHTWGFDAFDVIQDGIDAVLTGGTVNVAQGGYAENISITRDIMLVGEDARLVTIDGGGIGAVITATGLSSESKISGFTITNGSGYDLDTFTAGGGLYLYDSDTIVCGCIITNNTAGCGGAIYNRECSPEITNSLLNGNSAEFGGAIYNRSAAPNITNCTLTQNTASGSQDSDGGAVYSMKTSAAMLHNCILWNDSPNEIYVDTTSSATVENSDIKGSWPGKDNIDTAPLFVDSVNLDYRLMPDSMCIDTGLNSAAPAECIYDLNGLARVSSKQCGVNPIVDMGAYEFNRQSIGDFNDDCTIDYLDYTLFYSSFTTSEPLTDISPAGGDGIVDINDLQEFALHWLESFE